MGSSASLPNRGQQQYQLDPEAKQALGKVSPELAWLEVKTMVQQAIQLQFKEAEDMRLTANYPKDLGSLTLALEVMNPIWAINQLHYANENLNLQQIMKQQPLKILESVLKMMTVSDRYNSLLP